MSVLCLKYRLFPSKEQERKLADTLQTCRQVYNSLLNWRKHDYEVGNVHSQVLQNIAVRVDLAYQAFFRRLEAGEKPGFPRFKGEGYDSFCYPQSGFKVGESTISLSLFGRQERVKAKIHRPVVGRVKTCSVKNMLGNHCLSKSISDALWSMFGTVLTQKAESAAREVIAVNPAYTSQDCHACGYRAKKKLSERWHLCPMCGASLDRDTNAAINILNLATLNLALQTAVGQHSVGEVRRSPDL